MADLMARLEVIKLARELDTSEEELAFLTASTPEELRELRTVISEAMRARHADLVGRLAGLSRLLPVPLTATIAQGALGPVLSARVAGVLEPRDAARLAAHVDSDFLVQMATHVDPARVAPLVAAMPPAQATDVGRRLLAAGEHVTLARFLAVVDTDLAMTVVDDATAADLLWVALLADDRSALVPVLERLDDAMLSSMLAVAEEAAAYDAAVSLLSTLLPERHARIQGHSETD